MAEKTDSLALLSTIFRVLGTRVLVVGHLVDLLNQCTKLVTVRQLSFDYLETFLFQQVEKYLVQVFSCAPVSRISVRRNIPINRMQFPRHFLFSVPLRYQAHDQVF